MEHEVLAEACTPPLDPSLGLSLLGLLASFSDEAVCLYDADEAIVWWNARYLEFFPEVVPIIRRGLPFIETVRRFLALQYPQQAAPERLQPYVDIAMIRHRTEQGPLEYQRASEGRWLELRMFPLPQGGRFKIWRDVTARHRQQASASRVFELLATINVGLLVHGTDGRLVYANTRFGAELTSGFVVSVPPLAERHDRAAFWRGFADVFVHDEVYRGLVEEVGGSGPLPHPVTLQTRNDRWVRIEEQAWDGGIASVWVDITENKLQEAALARSQDALVAANRRLTEMAERDPLTGLFNRRKFLGDADLLMAQNDDFALILLDLDHFKDVNDRYGHQAGDDVLCAVAGILRAELPAGAIPGRLGGEEFAICLAGLAPEEARGLAEVLRRRLAATVLAHGAVVTASFGVVSPRPGEDFRGLMARADALLYEAKRAGRNRIAD